VKPARLQDVLGDQLTSQLADRAKADGTKPASQGRQLQQSAKRILVSALLPGDAASVPVVRQLVRQGPGTLRFFRQRLLRVKGGRR
jgi:hypothetical protein